MNGERFPLLDESRLHRELIARLPGHEITLSYLQSCASTNMKCMQKGKHGSVVVAEHQSAGRGRRGRTWLSPATANIYCSLGITKTIDADYLGMISLQAGVSIIRVLTSEGYDGLSLKWPNDILLHGKKLGGILIETRVNALNEFYLVIGFGLNAHLQASDLSAIDRPAISLNQAGHGTVDRQRLLPELIATVFDAVMRLQPQAMSGLIQEFTELDSYMGQQVLILDGDEKIRGRYLGLEPTGQIRIESSEGVKSFAAAEISLRASQHVAD